MAETKITEVLRGFVEDNTSCMVEFGGRSHGLLTCDPARLLELCDTIDTEYALMSASRDECAESRSRIRSEMLRVNRERDSMAAELDRLQSECDRDGWMKLPVDANGVPIRVGDEMDFLGHMTVDAIDGHSVFFFADNWADGVYCEDAAELRHHHAPTVEDVLRDFADKWLHTRTEDDEDELLAKYVDKFELAGDDHE